MSVPGCDTESHSLFDPALPGNWLVLHTKPQQERLVGQDLRAKGVLYFLPLVPKVRFIHGKRSAGPVPLFPGYLFLRGEIDDAYAADRTKRIVSIIRVTNQDTIRQELQAIHTVLESGAVLEMYPYLKRGVRVEVRAGPFQGIRGIIADRANRNRLILQVDILGAAASLEVDGSLLDVLDD